MHGMKHAGQFEPSPRTAPTPYPAALYANLRTRDRHAERFSDRHFGRFEMARNSQKTKVIREFKSTVFLTYRISVVKAQTGLGILWKQARMFAPRCPASISLSAPILATAPGTSRGRWSCWPRAACAW